MSDGRQGDVVSATPGRWGAAHQPDPLTDTVRDYLSARVGPAVRWPVREPELSAIAPPALDPDVLTALAAITGHDHLHTSAESRWRAPRGASYSDYVRQRAGDVTGLPEAVIVPADHDQTQAIVSTCSQAGVALVPAGGGTSVVAGLSVREPFLALSTRRMRQVFEVDECSGIVRVGAGITGPELEPILAGRGLTLGHLPQSWQRASIGGYLATRSAGQASTGFGRSDDMVTSVRMASPAGSWSIGHAPSSAAGPELLGMVIGSEGAFGVITEASLRVRRRATQRRYEAWIFPGYEAGLEAFRELAHTGMTADVMRLSDEPETATTLLMSGPAGVRSRVLDAYLRRRGVARDAASLAILGWEGVDARWGEQRRSAAVSVLRRHGAVSLGRRAGDSWRRHRFDGPLLRDALLDAGYLVETVETSTRWANLTALRDRMHAAVTDALAGPGNAPYVMTHVSHVYETGASLYTTVLCVADQLDPLAQWGRAKAAVTQAILDHGGTLTHHHAVGRDHAPWLGREIGTPGLDVLRAVKGVLDPHGVCNPGVLGL